MKIIDINLKNSILELKKWYFQYDNTYGELLYRPHPYEEYLQNIDDYFKITIETTDNKLEFVLLREEFYFETYNREEDDTFTTYIEEIFYKNIRKRTSQLKINELNEMLSLFEKALDFIKKRMKENIYNGQPDSILKKDGEIKRKIEEFEIIVKKHLEYEEKIVERKLKKYNLK